MNHFSYPLTIVRIYIFEEPQNIFSQPKSQTPHYRASPPVLLTTECPPWGKIWGRGSTGRPYLALGNWSCLIPRTIQWNIGLGEYSTSTRFRTTRFAELEFISPRYSFMELAPIIDESTWSYLPVESFWPSYHPPGIIPLELEPIIDESTWSYLPVESFWPSYQTKDFIWNYQTN